jgi:hypothetical protein
MPSSLLIHGILLWLEKDKKDLLCDAGVGKCVNGRTAFAETSAGAAGVDG